jgi:hypothetical protein
MFFSTPDLIRARAESTAGAEHEHEHEHEHEVPLRNSSCSVLENPTSDQVPTSIENRKMESPESRAGLFSDCRMFFSSPDLI